ncbi:MAG: hypothetical protein ABR587_01880 [Candidatus Binatia bacterium]
MEKRGDPDFEFHLDDPRREVLRRHARVIAGRGDPATPVTAAHAFRPPANMTPAQGLGLLAAMALVLLSSFVTSRLVDWLGVHEFAAILLAIAVAAALGLRGAIPGEHRSLPVAERIALLGTLAFAMVSGSATALALLPAIVQAAVARLLLASLGDETTLIEKGARISHPLAPDFIGSYCRKLTAVWAAMFAASAAFIALCALGGFTDMHRTWTGWLFWALLSAFCVVEFFWRKSWFRYFGDGPLDRLLARAFPPANTERGRRSHAYLLRMRQELARLAEVERRRRTAG